MFNFYTIINLQYQKILQKKTLKKMTAFILCVALLVNTISFDTMAAPGNTLSQDNIRTSEEAPLESSQDGKDDTEDSTLPYDAVSVSTSDSGLEPDMIMYAAAASDEYLQLDVVWPENSYNNGILTLKNELMSCTICPGLGGSSVNTPILKISIPSCMKVTDYLDETNEFLQSNLAATEPVSKSEDSNGNTILTYRFVPNIAWLNFAINAQIPFGSQVQNNQTYQIKLEYYDGTTLLASEAQSFTTSMDAGKLSLSSALQDTCSLQENTPSYYIGPYTWRISANSVHYPYTSLKMIVPLPPKAVPVDIFYNQLPDNVPRSFGNSMNRYTITYCSNYHYQSDDNRVSGDAAVLIYELADNNRFLTYGDYIYLNYTDNTNELYLCFTDPKPETYQSAASPRIECSLGDHTVTMLDYGTTNLTSVSFSKKTSQTVIQPDNKWNDVIYLKENVSVYDTRMYERGLTINSTVDAAYDSVKMTVLLPEGAVPGFGNGNSFIPLTDGKTEVLQPDWKLQATYYHNRSYSNADGSIQGHADMLVYEMLPFTVTSGHSEYLFEGRENLYLRFTNPTGGISQSAASPKIEVTRNGNTTTMYDFNSTDYLTSVTFVQPSEESGAYPDFVANGGSGWSDTITLEKNKTIYYTSPYNRTVYSPQTSIYPYDLLRMTVLLPDEAVPGFGSEETFSPLKNGETYTILSSWKVTYHEQYSYSNEDGTVKGIAKALVYELSSTDPRSSYFLNRRIPYYSFSGGTEEDTLHLRFTNPELKTYSSAASPKVECIMDGKLYVSAGYFSQTELDTSVTFEKPKTDWTLLSVSGDTNETPYDLRTDFLVPETYQNNKEYYGLVTNNTGYTLKNVRILYEFDKDLNVNQLKLNLGRNGYPENAVIVYTTTLDETEKTARLNASDNVLALEAGNAFVTAEVMYDTLAHSATSKKLLSASLHNYGKKIPDSPGFAYPHREIKTVALSADSELDSSDDSLTSTDIMGIFIINQFLTLSSSSYTNPRILNKGDDFTVILGSQATYYQNLTIYLRMPKGYLLTDYTPPKECKDGEYRLTSRSLENGDILYGLEYTDDVMHRMYYDGTHTFSFHVGLEADTSVQQRINIPKAIYTTTEENALFQFSSRKTEASIGLDVNGDGDMEDKFYMPTPNTVDVNPLGLINIVGYLSANGQIGEAQNYEYTCNSIGNYHCVIYNGLNSGASASDASIRIALPKKDCTLTYNGTTYISQYDALMTGPAKLQGDFLNGSSVRYSTDGQNWLTEDEVKDYTPISYIEVQTVKGCSLDSADSAYIDIPFIVSFPDSGTVENAYIDLSMQYNLNVADVNPQIARKINTLKAKSVEFNGTIYQDKNHNGKQDSDELSNDKSYTLQLYYGKGTEGTPLQEITTDAISGRYDFNIMFPGTYTLHVEKDDDEFYGESAYFDSNGNYTFTLDKNVPAPATKKINMGILTQIVLEKPQFAVLPDSPDGKEGWYVTLPQITLLPMVSSAYVNTMFWHDEEPEQKLTTEIFPSVKETGTYAFRAYNEMVSTLGTVTATSDTSTLDLKIDVDAPVIKNGFSCSIAGTDQSAAVNFLTFGNFFNKAIQITIMAEDVGSGIDALYYTLPGKQTQSVKPDHDGYLRFVIPMDTAGSIAYYVEDHAGNKSGITTLKKEGGSELWVIENHPPVWGNFVLTDTNGNSGVRGADSGIWFAGTVNASAQVTDMDSGLAHITSRINEGITETRDLTGNTKLTAFNFAATAKTEGTNLLWAEAEDNATNTARTQITFGIDTTAPVIVLENKTLTNVSKEKPLAMKADQSHTTADDLPTATVLVRDTGSGVDPDSIRVLWQGQEKEFEIRPAESGYRLTFPITEMSYTDSDDTFLVTARDYTGWSTEFSVTRHQKQIIYVAADTGSDVTGNGSRTYPVQTLAAALERVFTGGMIVLLEDYNGTAYINLEVTLDLNGKVLHGDVSGSALTVGPAGSLTIMDSNGLASAAEGFKRDPESEGEIFGGIPGDPAFSLEKGTLCLADGTIYCGYTGEGDVTVMDEARMMYLLTYVSGGGKGEAPGLHYIEENTTDALKQNTFHRKGYTFRGWLYQDQLYEPGQKILMPGRNMTTVAKWAKNYKDPQLEEDEPEEIAERGNLDSVPKTGNEKNDPDSTSQTGNRMELYFKAGKKEDEQNTED